MVTERTIILPPNPEGGSQDAQYRLTVMVPKRRYLSYLRERWWVVVVFVALSVGTVLTYETVRSERYVSSAELYLSGESQVMVPNMFTEDSMNYFGTQIELLKSFRLQNAVFEALGVKLKPDAKSPVDVDVFQPLKTSILVVKTSGSDPDLTQRFLQGLIQEYLSYKKDTRRSSSEDLLLSVNEQVAKKDKELQTEQDKWADFAKSNNVAVLEEEAKSAGLYLAQLNLDLAKLRLDCTLLEQGLSPATTASLTNVAASTLSGTNGIIGALGSNSFLTGSDAVLKSVRVELAVRRAERDELLKERGEIAVRRLSDEVAHLEKTVSFLEEQNLTQKRVELQENQKRIAAIESTIPSWEMKVLSLNDRLSQSQRYKNNIQREQGYYDHLLTTLQNVDLGKNIQQERLSVLQTATSARPVKRYLAIRIILAVLAGLFMSLGLVFGWYLLDDRFVSVRDIQDQFGEKILGLVPQIRIPRSKPERAVLQANDGRLAYAESYRHLRSALLLSSLGERRPQTLLFTGVAPAEGKTTVAVNLARLLARSGLRVALVDADVHGGGIKRLLAAQDQAGVLDYLRGEVEAKAILHRADDVAGLTFVPAGSHTDHAEGLFLRPRLAELMTELRVDQDFVILDGGPILASDDVALLVPHADAVVMVMRPFYTRSRLVRQALDMLYQRQARQVTIILNRARKDDLNGHYARNGLPQPSNNGAPLTT
jgi:Mrp family chromosome partitioning ATPase/uncharacterized protein involved in exopolysaccharide biosynthesis